MELLDVGRLPSPIGPNRLVADHSVHCSVHIAQIASRSRVFIFPGAPQKKIRPKDGADTQRSGARMRIAAQRAIWAAGCTRRIRVD
jgi:hypothetical protein